MLDRIVINPEEYAKLDSSYYYDNHKVPRVTRILARCVHEDGLVKWANFMGFSQVDYDDFMEDAATIGNETHNGIRALMEHGESQMTKQESLFAYNSFLTWYHNVSYWNLVQPIMYEQSIICKFFGGTLDALYKINNKLYIVDYKTSNHIVLKYALQIAAYVFILQYIHNIFIDGCILLQLSKESIGYNEYALNFSNPVDLNFINQAKSAFLIMVLWYYNLGITEEDYNNLEWGE